MFTCFNVQTTHYFSHTVCLNIPVFILFQKRSVLAHFNGMATELLGNSLGPCLLPVSWCHSHTLKREINWDTFRMFTFKTVKLSKYLCDITNIQKSWRLVSNAQFLNTGCVYFSVYWEFDTFAVFMYHVNLLYNIKDMKISLLTIWDL